ncbi:MAG: DUF4373 domain-containing protein [Akkermansia sp.]
MARPRKQGVDYFPFDVDFFQDEKIVAIGGEFGIKGELAAIKLLCAVYRNGYFIEWSEMLRAKLLRELPGVSAELLSQIVNRLVRWGLFNQPLFDSVKVLTSAGIQRRYFSIRRIKPTPAEYPHLLHFCSNNGVFAAETRQNTQFLQQKQGKVKEKEENTTVEVVQKSQPPPPPPPQTTPLSLQDEIDALRADKPWLRSVARMHAVTPGQLNDRIEEFHLQCIADGKPCHQSMQDAKQHFNAWLRIVTAKQSNPDNHANTRHHPPKQRTGLEVTAASPADYQTAF